MPFGASSGETRPSFLAVDSVCCQDIDFHELPDVVWRAAMLEDRAAELDAAEAGVAGDLELLAVMRDSDVPSTWGRGADP